MSTHAIEPNIDLTKVIRILAQSLRLPSGIVQKNGIHQPPTALEFTPDLTIAEQAALVELLAIAARPMTDWTPADEAKITTELAAIRTFVGATSPTAAQTLAFQKAVGRIVLALLRA
ncbi:MAG: hypothetical protein M3Q08_18535 [Pseudomonadota bacterium]|nr:hypothetical protein [Pseudomonadota bacterium]